MKQAELKQTLNQFTFDTRITIDKKLNKYRGVTPKSTIDRANAILAHLDMNQLNALVLKDKAAHTAA